MACGGPRFARCVMCQCAKKLSAGVFVKSCSRSRSLAHSLYCNRGGGWCLTHSARICLARLPRSTNQMFYAEHARRSLDARPGACGPLLKAWRSIGRAARIVVRALERLSCAAHQLSSRREARAPSGAPSHPRSADTGRGREERTQNGVSIPRTESTGDEA